MKTVKTDEAGFLFVATGEKYIALARRAVHSVRRHHPGHPICLVTDREFADDGLIDRVMVLDHVQPTQGPNARNRAFATADKVRGIRLSPFQKTLYLDCDTWVLDSVHELFDVLDHFDLIGATDPKRRPSDDVPDPLSNALALAFRDVHERVPECFPQINAGVIGIRKNTITEAFLEKWESLAIRNARRDDRAGDQIAMMEAQYAMPRIRYAPLPHEYNLYILPVVTAYGKVKIVHGHHPDLPSVGREINRYLGYRAFHARFGLIRCGDHDALCCGPIGRLRSIFLAAAKIFLIVVLGRRDLRGRTVYRLDDFNRRAT